MEGCDTVANLLAFRPFHPPSIIFGGIAAMRMLVLGAGLQGSACAYDLLQRPDVTRVTLADLNPRRAAAHLKKKKDKRLVLARLHAKHRPPVQHLVRRHHRRIDPVPYYL